MHAFIYTHIDTYVHIRAKEIYIYMTTELCIIFTQVHVLDLKIFIYMNSTDQTNVSTSVIKVLTLKIFKIHSK